MPYNFDLLINRFNTDSLKWDVLPDELPMWVADMDFQTAPEIIDALEKRLSHGVFGYNIVPKEWYRSICCWWETQHRFSMDENWLLFCTGVVPAISSIVRKMTTVGENVLIQTPVYNIFFNSIVNNGRHVLESPLHYDGQNYHIDFDDLETKLADPQTTLMILCNPHNPIGKIWDKETLQKIGHLCAKHHVLVLSDEIHCDLTDPDKTYVPFASVSEECRQNSITCIAPTKAFNLAGLQTAAIVVPNPILKEKVNRGINTDEVAEPNSFAVSATIAAFTKGALWLAELKKYLAENKKIVSEYLKRNLPELHLVSSEATYLLWIDCSALTDNALELTEWIRKTTGLYLSDGGQYGQSGKTFIRMNIACPKKRLEDGLDRLRKGVKEWSQK